MSRETDAGRVMANAIELGKNIMAQVVSDNVRPPQVTEDQAQEELAAKIINNLTERAGV